MHRRRARMTWLLMLSTLLVAAACQPLVTPGEQTAAAPTPTPAPATDTPAPGDLVLVPTPTPVPVIAPSSIVIAVETVAEGLDQPLFVTHAGDGSGRLFVVEKPGAIRVIQDGALLPEPFLEITDRVNDGASEQGLLGLAFAPNFGETGHFFVNYTDATGDTVVARFQLSPDDSNRADPASEFTVLTIDQPASNHNGGMLAFGRDGYLYIATGDGGGGGDRYGNGQNPDTLLGKVLRIDVTRDPSQPYLIPADNPWVEADWNGVDVRDEIWAVGLRNPWRYSFDRRTGDLWIPDVGQNQYEEVNVTPAGSPGGLNYGWPIMEASHCYPASAACDQAGLVLPVAEYTHEGGNCSVTGGYVYRGAAHPALDGVYFFGDYCSGRVWALAPNAAGAYTYSEVLDTGMAISSFGEDEAGELYVTDLSGGMVARLVYATE